MLDLINAQGFVLQRDLFHFAEFIEIATLDDLAEIERRAHPTFKNRREVQIAISQRMQALMDEE